MIQVFVFEVIFINKEKFIYVGKIIETFRGKKKNLLFRSYGKVIKVYIGFQNVIQIFYYKNNLKDSYYYF